MYFFLIKQVNRFVSWIEEAMNSTAEEHPTATTTTTTTTMSPEHKLAFAKILKQWLRSLLNID
jgi:hypothetical protein